MGLALAVVEFLRTRLQFLVDLLLMGCCLFILEQQEQQQLHLSKGRTATHERLVIGDEFKTYLGRYYLRVDYVNDTQHITLLLRV
jgi:hypothetical protein